MSVALRVLLGIAVIVYVLLIVRLLSRRKLNLQYALIWFFAAVVLLLMVAFPNSVIAVSALLGIEVPSNFVFVAEGLFVLLILLSLTTIVSRQTDQIYRLTQKQALLEKRLRDLENQLTDVE